MANIQKFKAISFDCYGTLIDWEKGLLSILRPWLHGEGGNVDDETILKAFAHHESEEQSEVQSAPYPEILEGVHIAIARQFKVKSSRALREQFMASVGNWPCFDDTIDALKSLKKDYKLIILSNVDNASFAKTNAIMGVEFDAIYTAEDICSYKPTKANFNYLLDHAKADLGLKKQDILHTAQSLFHDHEPAQGFGLKTCWIDRRKDSDKKTIGGATPPPKTPVSPHWTFNSMAEFATAMKK
jgi:2-haloalkanoic acid dehalogenase type II